MTKQILRRNVEFKARDTDPAGTLTRCQQISTFSGLLHQRDTYFCVPRGRLKLREQRPGGATLIQYERADTARARVSSYILVEISDPVSLKQALANTLSIACVVEKERQLFLFEETVRIHLDHVKSLGDFIEIEAVCNEESNLSNEEARVARLKSLLAIEEEQIVDVSYGDLIG